MTVSTSHTAAEQGADAVTDVRGFGVTEDDPPVFPQPRPWLRATLFTLGGLITVLALFWATTGVAGTLAQTTERFTRTVDGDITAVEIRTVGSVRIRPGPPEQVQTNAVFRFGLDRPSFTQRLDQDGVLQVRAACRGINFWCSVDLDLAVPAEVPLRVRAASARLADLSGPVTVDGSAGDVHLDRLSGALRLNLGAGEIEAQDLTSSDVRAGAGAGSVRLDFAEPPEDVEARTGAGEVEVLVPRDGTTYRVEASAGAGDTQVSVGTDPNSERSIRADAGAGSARIGYRLP